MAGRVRVPGCGHAGGWRLGDGRFWCCRLRRADVGDGGHDLRPHAHAADGVVHGVLAVRHAEGRGLGARACSARWRSAPTRPRGRCCTGCARCWCAPAGSGSAAWSRSTRPTSAARSPACAAAAQKGKKVLVGSRRRADASPRASGRCRMASLADASAASLRPFLTDHVEPGSTVITDGWQAYRPATAELATTTSGAASAPGARRGPRAAARRAPSRLARQALAARHPPRLRRRGAPAAATSTSSCSASTAAAPAAAGWSSTASSSSPSPTTRSATATSWSTRNQRSALLPGDQAGATRPPSNARRRTGRGERPDQAYSA